MTEHKPCPFCGSKDGQAMVLTGFQFHSAHVTCGNCGAQGPECTAKGRNSYKEAVNGAWDCWDNRPREKR